MYKIWKDLKTHFEVKKYLNDHPEYVPKIMTIPAEFAADMMLYTYRRNNERLRYMLENLKAINRTLEHYTKEGP